MTKYAFFPGCVSRGACPELYVSVKAVAAKLGIELDELTEASCTGAGVLTERNPELADTLNARTFALAEQKGYDTLMTICSTCQGVQRAANFKMQDRPEYLAKINENLKDQGLQYSGKLEVKHLLWILVEDIGLDKLRKMVKRPLSGLRVGPFYGCYIVRPTAVLGYKDKPERGQYLEQVIEALGGTPVDYSGKKECCGFPIVTMNLTNSLRMTGNHLAEAKEKGADCLVTPCPLCHLNLDTYQPDAAKINGQILNLPILHLPQLLGLALGLDEQSDLRMHRHVISTKPVVAKLQVAAARR